MLQPVSAKWLSQNAAVTAQPSQIAFVGMLQASRPARAGLNDPTLGTDQCFQKQDMLFVRDHCTHPHCTATRSAVLLRWDVVDEIQAAIDLQDSSCRLTLSAKWLVPTCLPL